MNKAIEMSIEPGTDALILKMGRVMKTRARSKVIDRTLDHIRQDHPVSEVTAWFRESAIASARRTTVRVSEDNANYLAAIAATVGQGRPAVLMGLVYFAASQLTRDDLESLRS